MLVSCTEKEFQQFNQSQHWTTKIQCFILNSKLKKKNRNAFVTNMGRYSKQWLCLYLLLRSKYPWNNRINEGLSTYLHFSWKKRHWNHVSISIWYDALSILIENYYFLVFSCCCCLYVFMDTNSVFQIKSLMRKTNQGKERKKLVHGS